MRRPALGFLAFLASSALLAQDVDVPLRNWTVPPYTQSGLTTMTDVTPPRLFVGIAPCRIADTRSGQGFSGQAGPPALSANVTRNFQITGTVTGVPAQCGIPVGADAVSFQFSVGLPTSSGNFIAWPAGGAQPTTSVLNWDGPIGFLGNATIIPVSAGGALSVRLNAAAGQSAHLILDVNGYFSDTLGEPANYLYLTNNSTIWTAQFNNDSTTCNGTCGVLGTVASGYAGVFFSSETNADINGGVFGSVSSSGAGSAGAEGVSNAATGETYGVLGINASSSDCSAGVHGRSGGLIPCTGMFFGTAGVFGTNTTSASGAWGVLGNALVRGTQGSRVDASGAGLTFGVLGYLGNSGVHSFNDITAAGVKPFVEPHPTDASKELIYVALEGAEVGTYFRGRAKFERGVARIEIPEHFRMLTEPEGLSIQVTPIGEMATFAVARIDLDGIVIRGSRNVEFFYTVNGVRKNYAGFQPIQDNVHFVPSNAQDAMYEWPAAHKRKLASNGTLTPDGKVNMETAQRLGWTEQWERDRLRAEAQREADREADRVGRPTGSVPAQRPE